MSETEKPKRKRRRGFDLRLWLRDEDIIRIDACLEMLRDLSSLPDDMGPTKAQIETMIENGVRFREGQCSLDGFYDMEAWIEAVEHKHEVFFALPEPDEDCWF